MANIAIATYGTEGDVRPVILLAKQLTKANHEVTVFGPPDVPEHSVHTDFNYISIGEPMKTTIKQAGDPTKERLDSDKNAFAFLKRQIATQLEVLPKHLEHSDFIIAAQLAWGAASVAQKLNIPYRYIAYTPQVIPFGHFPPIVSRNPGAPAWMNWLTWWAYRKATDMGFKKIINTWHSQHSLPPISHVWEHVLGDTVILASDAIFGSHTATTTPTCVQTGFFSPPSLEHDALSPALINFLNSGEPPIYAGFGSMPGGDQQKITKMLIDGARLAKKRLILGGGWGELHSNTSETDVFQISYEPFSLLFKSVALVIHHGGAGTTSTAARAGVPQFIIPHMGDQFFFGHQIHALNLGPKPIPLGKLTTKKIATAITMVEQNSSLHNATKEIAHSLAHSQGLQHAVQYIEDEIKK